MTLQVMDIQTDAFGTYTDQIQNILKRCYFVHNHVTLCIAERVWKAADLCFFLEPVADARV